MALYYVKLTFTGDLPSLKPRPEEKTFVVRARTLNAAAKRTVKYAKRFWPYYRFDLECLDLDRVLE